MLCCVEPLEMTEAGKKEFGRMLASYRRHVLKTSQRGAEKYIEERCGRPVSFNTISAIERGHRDVDMATLLLFAQAGYGGMSLNEMADVLTDRRLAVCESGETYHA